MKAPCYCENTLSCERTPRFKRGLALLRRPSRLFFHLSLPLARVPFSVDKPRAVAAPNGGVTAPFMQQLLVRCCANNKTKNISTLLSKHNFYSICGNVVHALCVIFCFVVRHHRGYHPTQWKGTNDLVSSDLHQSVS